MKTYRIIIAAIVCLASLAGCQEALENRHVLYLTGTENSPLTSMFVDGPKSTPISVTSSQKMNKDVTVNIGVADASEIERLNAERGTLYQMIPAGSFALAQDYVTIGEGKNISNNVMLEINNLDDFEEGVQYCIPVTIKGNSDGIGILETSRIQYILIDKVLHTKGINLANSWYVTMPAMEGDESLKLSACTMELRVHPKGFRTSGHMISTLMGVEENFLLRAGDESIKNATQVQLAGQGTSVTGGHLSLDQWFHVAVTDTGSELTIYINGEPTVTANSSSNKGINLGFKYNTIFGIGWSGDSGRNFNGYVSEARIWNRALSAAELKAGQCFVDVTRAEGLIGYWRLNEVEADGRTFKDLSGKGYDAVASRNVAAGNFIDLKCPVID